MGRIRRLIYLEREKKKKKKLCVTWVRSWCSSLCCPGAIVLALARGVVGSGISRQGLCGNNVNCCHQISV